MSAPSAPIIQPQAWASNNSITFYWEPPSSIGSTEITSYTLLCSSIPYITVFGPSTYNAEISSLTNNVDYVFQLAATNSDGTSPYSIFNTAQAGNPSAGATEITASTINLSTVLVGWSYSTNANECKAQYFGVSIIPSSLTKSTIAMLSYPNQRSQRITNLSPDSYQFLVQPITNAGWAYPYIYSYSPQIFVGPVPFTPRSIPGMQLWFDGNDQTSITMSGSNVSQWSDKSGNSYNTSSVTGTPTYTQGVGIVLNGSSYFSLPDGSLPYGNTSYSVYIVSTLSPSGQDCMILSGGQASANSMLRFQYAGTAMRTSFFSNDLDIQLGSNKNLPNVFSSLYLSGGTRNVYLFGANIVTNTPAARTQPATNNRIGTWYNTEGQIMNGSISEILVYSSNHTTPQRQIVEGYLAWKWQLRTRLPTTHPYYTSAPTGVTAFNPTMITGLQLWLDGADPSATGIPPADNAVITQFVNKGAGATSMTFTGNPTYQRGYAGGNGALKFNEDAYIRDTVFQGTLASKTFFIVCSTINGTTNTPQGFFVFGLSGNGFAVRNGCAYQGPEAGFNNSFGFLQAYTNGGYYYSVGTSLANTALGIYSDTTSGTAAAIYVNGSNVSNQTLTYTPTNSTGFQIGRRLIGNNLSGYICEIMAFNRVLSLTDRQMVEGYLAWKWGTQTKLSTTHPYYNSPVTFIMPRPVVYLYALTYSGSGTWNDSSGNGKNATLISGTGALIAKNAEGNGIVLNGATAWSFPSAGVANAWAVNIWYKKTGVDGNNAFIVAQSDSTNLVVGHQNDINTFRVGYFSNGWTNNNTFTLTTGVWTNIQGSWDGTTISVFKNGILVGTTQPGGFGTNTNAVYHIGARDNRWYMTGEIGEISIYNEPLTSAQLLNLYNTTASTYFP